MVSILAFTPIFVGRAPNLLAFLGSGMQSPCVPSIIWARVLLHGTGVMTLRGHFQVEGFSTPIRLALHAPWIDSLTFRALAPRSFLRLKEVVAAALDRMFTPSKAATLGCSRSEM